MRPFSLIVHAALLLSMAASAHAQAPMPEATRAALDAFTGAWRGPFVVRAADGAPLDSLVAEHRYRWDGDVQRGTFVDRYADGRIVRAEAANYVRKDGTLVCKVTKTGADGRAEATVHTGRVLADGSVVWYRATDAGLVESYRERVAETPNGAAYRIDGFGTYPSGGDAPPTRVLFYGRYAAVPE